MKAIASKRKMLNELLDSCNTKLQESPDDSDILTLRALILNGIELYDEAIKDLNKIIEQDPNDENTYYLRSDCFIHKGEYDLAKKDFLRALKIEKKDERPLFFSLHPEDVLQNAQITYEQEIEEMKIVIAREKWLIVKSFQSGLDLLFEE